MKAHLRPNSATRRLSIVLVLLALLVPSASLFPQGAAGGKDALESQIAALADTYGGIIGVCAANLATGDRIAVQEDSMFATASTIKVPILVELFYKFHDGSLRRDQMLTLADTNKWGGSGVFQYFNGTSEQKLIDAAAMMIIVSDNTATNMVLDALADTHDAKLAAVNDRMKALGLKHTELLNKLMSYATKKKTPESLRFGVGYSTPSDMVLLLTKIAKREIIDSASCGEMIGLMENNDDYTMAVRYFPFDSLKAGDTLVVAHKTGSVSDVKVDVGIVYGPTANYVYAIFTDKSKDEGESVDNRATLAVARASRMLYDYFER